MSHQFRFLSKESVASIRDIQKNPSRALRGLTRVTRGSKTIGFFLANEEMDELLEDLEMLASTKLKTRVKQARKEIKAGQTTSLADVMKKYEV
jgi:hypothetical protein